MIGSQPKPPKTPEWLMIGLARHVEKYSLVDDIKEEFYEILSERGKAYAQAWYWKQVLRAVPFAIFYSVFRNVVMFKNYATIALRKILRHKVFSFINIIGLAISMSLCLLVIKMMFAMYSSDRFHENKDRIYRITSTVVDDNYTFEFSTAPLPLAYELEQIPDVEKVIRIKKNFGGPAVYGDKVLQIQGFYADKDFFHVFSFELEKGDSETALSEPNSIVLTKKLALKFFGTRDPIGEILSIKDSGDFKITGVMKDTSKIQSHMRFECLASISTLVSLESQKKIRPSLENWKNLRDNYVYFMLRETASPQGIKAFFPGIVEKHYSDTESSYGFHLQALTKISPGKNLGNPLSAPPVTPEVPYILSCIAFIIILIACFNYTNLSLAKALSRAKEVGIRKAIGANRFKLFSQFIGEAVTYSMIALLLSFLLTQFISTRFLNQFGLHFNLADQSAALTFAFILFAVFTGVLAGFIPAVYISKFNPAQVLKDITKVKLFSRITLRKALIVFQFFISFISVVTTVVFYKQIKFEKDFDCGFNAENILNVELQGTNYEAFRQEISSYPTITQVSASAFIPNTGTRWIGRAKPADWADFIEMDYFWMDEYFIENVNLEFIAGQNFPDNSRLGNEKFVILNEMAVEQFRFGSSAEALGKRIIFEDKSNLEVIGVVKNFISSSVSTAMKPLAMRIVPKYFDYANVKVNSNDIEPTLQFLEEKWKRLEPFRLFKYGWFEEQTRAMYDEGKKVLRAIGFITSLAILIAFFGLLGMVVYDTEERIKEIGIRKVLGASVFDIIIMISKGFIFLLLLAAVLATPVAWFANNLLLQDIAHHVELGVGIFAFGIFFMFAIGFIIIFSQTVKVAYRRPVDSLRYE